MAKSKIGIKGFIKTDKKLHKSNRISFFLDEKEHKELMLFLDAKKESKSKVLRNLVMNQIKTH